MGLLRFSIFCLKWSLFNCGYIIAKWYIPKKNDWQSLSNIYTKKKRAGQLWNWLQSMPIASAFLVPSQLTGTLFGSDALSEIMFVPSVSFREKFSAIFLTDCQYSFHFIIRERLFNSCYKQSFERFLLSSGKRSIFAVMTRYARLPGLGNGNLILLA